MSIESRPQVNPRPDKQHAADHDDRRSYGRERQSLWDGTQPTGAGRIRALIDPEPEDET